MVVVFIHGGDVIEDVFTLLIHATHTVLNDNGQLIAISRVVAHAIRNRSGHKVTVPILVLQPFAIECGAPGGTTNEKPSSLAITRCPCQVANALKAKHRIKYIERHHRIVGHTVRSSGGQPSRKSTRFIDALFQNLPRNIFLVIQNTAGIVGGVLLTDR